VTPREVIELAIFRNMAKTPTDIAAAAVKALEDHDYKILWEKKL